MLRNLRLVFRSLALGLVTGLHTLLLLVGWLPACAMGRRVAWRSWIMRSWAGAAARAMGIHVRCTGRPPQGAYLMVSNHLGYADIPVIASQTGCRFVSKAEIRSWPVVGPLARLAGTVFVDRRSRRDVVRVGGEIGAAVTAGSGVVFFPEGTSTRGERVESFRSSLLQPAAEAGLEVYAMSVRYQTPSGETPAELSVAWWGDMTLAPHLLDLLRMPRIDAQLVFGQEVFQSADRKQLALDLHAAVEASFEPMYEAKTSSSGVA